jgi:uncharacterized protein YqeY
MTTLLEQVTHDIADAMRRKDQTVLAPLRMLKAALMNREVEKGRPLDEAESLQVVASLVKQRRDSIDQFQSAGRQDLVDREQSEVVVLERFQPPAADEARVAQAIDAAIVETGASNQKDMGKVMKATLAGLEGLTVDGRMVSQLVKQRLSAG